MTKASDDTLDWIKGSDEVAGEGEAALVSGELVLEGALGIAEADAMHQSLLEILDANVDISIESENLSKVDTAGAQLLYAFVKEAKSRSLTLQWKSVSDALLDIVTELGLRDGMMFEASDA